MRSIKASYYYYYFLRLNSNTYSLWVGWGISMVNLVTIIWALWNTYLMLLKLTNFSGFQFYTIPDIYGKYGQAAKIFTGGSIIPNIISLIPRLSHRLSYSTIRTISWSWYSSTNYFMARALRVRSEFIIHMNPMCVAQSAACAVQ